MCLFYRMSSNQVQPVTAPKNVPVVKSNGTKQSNGSSAAGNVASNGSSAAGNVASNGSSAAGNAVKKASNAASSALSAITGFFSTKDEATANAPANANANAPKTTGGKKQRGGVASVNYSVPDSQRQPSEAVMRWATTAGAATPTGPQMRNVAHGGKRRTHRKRTHRRKTTHRRKSTHRRRTSGGKKHSRKHRSTRRKTHRRRHHKRN
jgi:hypothetical protein